MHCQLASELTMLSRSSRLASRGLATKAGLVKGLAAEQKAVLAAVNKLGPGAPFAKVNEVMQAEPHAVNSSSTLNKYAV